MTACPPGGFFQCCKHMHAHHPLVPRLQLQAQTHACAGGIFRGAGAKFVCMFGRFSPAALGWEGVRRTRADLRRLVLQHALLPWGRLPGRQCCNTVVDGDYPCVPCTSP